MDDANLDIMKAIMEEDYVPSDRFEGAAAEANKANFEKMKLAFETCMNEDAIKEYGTKPVKDLLEEFESIYPRESPAEPNADEMTEAVRWLSLNSVWGFISAGTGSDDKNPDVVVVVMSAGEVQFPKEYYNMSSIMANYTDTIVDMSYVIDSGKPIFEEPVPEEAKAELSKKAEGIIALEKRMAEASPDPEVLSDIEYYYNMLTLGEVDEMVPQVSLPRFFEGQIPPEYDLNNILLVDPAFYGNVSDIIQETPREVIHDYFEWRLLLTWAGRLHQNFTIPTRRLNNIIAGRQPDAISDRWRTCLSEVDGKLGHMYSAQYIEKAFSPEAKDFGDRIIKDIKDVFAERLKTFDWMSDEVKKAAAEKVVNILQKIGYQTVDPDVADPVSVQEHYKPLEITDNYYQNARNAYNWARNETWYDLLEPVDKNEWGMTAPEVNAYYNPTNNEIVFPAGIMQLPVFSFDLPEYVSYGAFGSVAGHELTHGFDDNGAHYDQTGRYADWWDNKTVENFYNLTQCFVGQYEEFTVPGLDDQPLHVNGQLTLGENIADAGGITASFEAWKKRDAAAKNPGLPGLEKFSNEQLFFISFSNWWCGKMRKESQVNSIYTDPHAPDPARIVGSVANSEGFKEAFGCKKKEPTCQLW